MTPEERDKLCKSLADKQTDEIPFEDLMQFFYVFQYDYFDDMADQELLDAAKEILG